MSQSVLSNLIIKRVLSTTKLFTAEGVHCKKGKRPGWALVLKYEGETVYKQNGKEIVSDSSSLIILPKGCIYEWTCTKSGHFIITEFESDLECESIICFPVKSSDKYLQQLQRLEYIMTLNTPTVQLEAIRDVYSILLSLIQRSNAYMPTDKLTKIAPALEYIAKHYDTQITNDELAELTGLSCVYFRKLFGEVIGESPIAYAHSLRIKKACEMLKSDFGSIADVAQTLGYSNIYDFSRDFKKHTGKPPSKY